MEKPMSLEAHELVEMGHRITVLQEEVRQLSLARSQAIRDFRDKWKLSYLKVARMLGMSETRLYQLSRRKADISEDE